MYETQVPPGNSRTSSLTSLPHHGDELPPALPFSSVFVWFLSTHSASRRPHPSAWGAPTSWMALFHLARFLVASVWGGGGGGSWSGVPLLFVTGTLPNHGPTMI